MEAAVKSDKRLRNKTAKGLDHFYLGLLAKRKILRGGETRLLLERDQKGDQAKSKALELFSQYFVVSSRAQKKINLDFSLEQLRSLPLKWLILFQNETQGTRLWFPSLRYWVFLPLPSQSVRPVGVRSYPDVITKISRIHRFPIFFSYEAPLARGGSAIIAKVQINTPYTLPDKLFTYKILAGQRKTVEIDIFCCGEVGISVVRTK